MKTITLDCEAPNCRAQLRVLGGRGHTAMVEEAQEAGWSMWHFTPWYPDPTDQWAALTHQLFYCPEHQDYGPPPESWYMPPEGYSPYALGCDLLPADLPETKGGEPREPHG